MAAGSIVSFKFVVNVSGSLQLFLQAVSAYQRGGTIHPIEIADFFRDSKISRLVIQFLLCQFRAEYMGKIF